MHFIALQHGGEDGWQEVTLLHTSRRKVGRELYRGHSNRGHRNDTVGGGERALTPAQNKRLWRRSGKLTIVGSLRIAEISDRYASTLLRDEREAEEIYREQGRG
jgi:hypothetical protein